MASKDYSDYLSNTHKSYDKNIIVEELLEKLKAQGCFDAKRKQFLSEITNKSSYQNLHTKVENLATKFLETVRWPPSVQKHQLREQLRLHIQSTDQFNNCVSRLIEQEVSCKIQAELKPMIESKACEYLEVNYEKWKQNMLSQIYETFQTDSPVEKFSHKFNLKKEFSNETKRQICKEAGPFQSIDSTLKMNNIKIESTLNQSNIVNSSSLNNSLHPQPKYATTNHIPPQIIHTNFIDTPAPTMPPPIGVLPPPHRLLFQSFPPPPSMLLSIERFPPPPPPEDKTLPPPPPPENGPITPTEEYNPKFGDVTENSAERIKSGLLNTPEKPMDKALEVKFFSPKKMIWGQIVLPVQDISDDTASDSDKFDQECRRFSRKSPPNSRNSNVVKNCGGRQYNDGSRQKETVLSQRRGSRVTQRTHSRQKANEYTDVSSDSFNEMEFKEVVPTSTNQTLNKSNKSSSSNDSHSSSSNDHTRDLIRKINKKKKTKFRNRHASSVRSQSSSSYSSSESSSESSSSDNSPRNGSSNTYRDSRREFRIFGRSQSKERDMDISIDTQLSPLDTKYESKQTEIKLDSLDSVQKRKNQIKARLEEIDAKRSLLQKQQLLTISEPMSISNTTSSSSTDSSSDNTSSSTPCEHNENHKKSSEITSKSENSPKRTSNSEFKEVSFNQKVKAETAITDDLQVKVDHDSEPEEGELSSESRAGSLRRENNANSSEKSQSTQINKVDSLKTETLVKETDECFDESVEMELGSDTL